MGNDGGDIPGHKQLVKQKQKIQVPDPQAVAVGRARYCNLTKQRLTLPMAICRLGYIFNYQALLRVLVEKRLHQKYCYIRKISDIRQIHPQLTDPSTSQNIIVCPISKLQYNGLNKFIALWSCGHVFSQKAIKEIEGSKGRCLTCDKVYTQADLVDLNMTPEDQEIVKEKLMSKVKAKKRKEEKEEEELPTGEPQRKVRKEVHLSKMEQLEGDVSGVIRGRDNYKELFHTKVEPEGELFINNRKLGIR